MATITTVMLPYMIMIFLFFGIANAFLRPVSDAQTFDIVNIEYLTEGQKLGVAECTLSKVLTADEIQKSEKELQCLHLPMLVSNGDNAGTQKMADYCAFGQNEKIAKCSDIAEVCEKKLGGRITLASATCSEIVHRQTTNPK
ncbi:hypothetical protein BDF20DRAFT_893498 [Mycotypha africana]|uniref:uncharacterized protein n=1 Tax=Mycotypha africana TaxID=64632 RepID=UPI002300EA9D|nr:uncharacterized protein BDF20DRAFT_893498 [Mycotypha africana]KAI8969160.1 hypothetical protein BDF20DRAFT_893498 [Mycotypha africana]